MVVGVGTLGHLQLAEQHGTRLTKAPDGGRVLGGPEVLVDRRARRSRHAAGPEEVLSGQRDAMERSAVTTGNDVRFCCPRLRQRALSRDDSVAGEPTIQRCDPVELPAGRLHRRDLTRPDPLGKRGAFQEMQIAHGVYPMAPTRTFATKRASALPTSSGASSWRKWAPLIMT